MPIVLESRTLPTLEQQSGAIGRVQADMLVLVQRVQFSHLSLAQLEIEDLGIGDDTFFGIRFG